MILLLATFSNIKSGVELFRSYHRWLYINLYSNYTETMELIQCELNIREGMREANAHGACSHERRGSGSGSGAEAEAGG